MKMKTIFGFLVALLVLSSTVYAGSIRDLQHWDRNSDKGELYGGTIQTIHDTNVQIDADTVKGVDVVNQLTSNMNQMASNMDYITNNEQLWLSSGGSGNCGVGYNFVQDFVTGDSEWLENKPFGYSVYDELSLTYATLMQVEAVNNRLDRIEAWLTVGTNSGNEYDMALAKLTSQRIGNAVSVGKYNCYPSGICFISD